MVGEARVGTRRLVFSVTFKVSEVFPMELESKNLAQRGSSIVEDVPLFAGGQARHVGDPSVH